MVLKKLAIKFQIVSFFICARHDMHLIGVDLIELLLNIMNYK